MKRRLIILLVMLITIFIPPSVYADELSLQTITRWRDQIIVEVSSGSVLNNPSETFDPSGNGVYLFDYGTVQVSASSLELTGETVAQIQINSDQIADPYNIRVGMGMDEVLASFPNENEQLTGDDAFAVLYASMTDTAYTWAWVMRSGETVYGVQYALSEKLQDDHYGDAGILYVMDEGKVSSIRVYGLNAQITKSEAQMNMQTAIDISTRANYTPPQIIARANQDTLLTFVDLTIDGKLLLQLGKDQVIQALGEPISSSSMLDEAGISHTLIWYDGLNIQLSEDDSTVQSVNITSSSIAGPRNIGVGMTLEEVLDHIHVGEDVREGKSSTLYMEGEAIDDPPYGAIEFYGSGRCTVRLSTVTDTPGETASVLIDIEDGIVQELHLYYYSK